MAIITISTGSYSHGKEVAEKVAERLGYRCIAREVILEASKEFNIPEVRLFQAIHDPPSILERFSHSGKELFISYFQVALLKSLQSDNVVYHGLAGHFYVHGVSHVLKVRIIADLEDRIRLVMEREKISHESAEERIRKDDAARRKWSRHLYGIDSNDPALYDMVIRVRNLTVANAVDAICHAAMFETFSATPESRQTIEDLLLAGEVRAALMGLKPDIQVTVRGGEVYLGVEAYLVKEPSRTSEMVKFARLVPGVRNVSVEARHD